nr:beta-1,3-galactosyltransferase 2-like [Gasterosteus aculeatus aculeatus]
MLESGSAPLGRSQKAVDAGKLQERRRWYRFSRRQFLFLILVLTVLYFLYNTNIKESAGWFSSNSQRQSAVSTNTSGSGAGGPGSEHGGFATAFSLAASPPNRTSPVATDAATQRTTPSEAEKATAPPYRSPSPYLVEYPSEYHFVVNEPEACERQKAFLVLVVPVAPGNRAHRDIIRNTWGGEGAASGRAVALLFLTGLPGGEGAAQVQEQLLLESRQYHDLIQSDFLDCYKNLTIKTMVMMEWLDSHCSGASYAMKIDSDMFLNVPKLVEMLLDAPKTNYMTGLVERGGAVLRDRTSKWFLPEEIYPWNYYPGYALGLGYVLSLDLPKKLVEASRHVDAVYIEDVFLGLCMKHLGIQVTDPPSQNYFHVFPREYSRCAYSQLIATTTNSDVDRVSIWKDFKRPGPYC